MPTQRMPFQASEMPAQVFGIHVQAIRIALGPSGYLVKPLLRYLPVQDSGMPIQASGMPVQPAGTYVQVIRRAFRPSESLFRPLESLLRECLFRP
jgi:hypothetical protein